MATHSSILAWRSPWTEAWRATVRRVAKSQTGLKGLSTQHEKTGKLQTCSLFSSSFSFSGNRKRKTYSFFFFLFTAIFGNLSQLEKYKRRKNFNSGNSNWGFVTSQRGGKGWEVAGRFKREGTHVHLWLIHVDVQQKSNQYWKATIFQLKINTFKEKKKNFKYFQSLPPEHLSWFFYTHFNILFATLSCIKNIFSKINSIVKQNFNKYVILILEHIRITSPILYCQNFKVFSIFHFQKRLLYMFILLAKHTLSYFFTILSQTQVKGLHVLKGFKMHL